jgi:hypothetical protein
MGSFAPWMKEEQSIAKNTIVPDSRAVVCGTRDPTVGLQPGVFVFGKGSPAIGHCRK